MKIEGRNAVEEALKSDLTVDRLIAQRDLKDTHSQRIIDLAKNKGIKISFLNKDVLDKESFSKRHQGFIAEVTDYKYHDLDEILEVAENPFFLILDSVEDPHNLGSILRVAESADVTAVIIPKHRSASVNETVIKVSAGTASNVKVVKVTNINDAIDKLKKQNVWVYAADLNGGEIYKTDLKGSVAIVIGGEDKGIGQRTKSNCDGIITIPMRGKVNSLNASVATAVCVYEKLRQERG